MGKIVQILEQSGFRISNLKMVKMNQNEAMDFYHDKSNNPFIQDLVSFVSSDVTVGIELVRENAISALQ